MRCSHHKYWSIFVWSRRLRMLPLYETNGGVTVTFSWMLLSVVPHSQWGHLFAIFLSNKEKIFEITSSIVFCSFTTRKFEIKNWVVSDKNKKSGFDFCPKWLSPGVRHYFNWSWAQLVLRLQPAARTNSGGRLWDITTNFQKCVIQYIIRGSEQTSKALTFYNLWKVSRDSARWVFSLLKPEGQ